MTSDNGYFLYYDKSVVTDPSTLEGVLAQVEAAGKKFYMEINSGWYQTAFFFGTGAQLTYDVDEGGNLVKANIDYASDKGVAALKAMIALNRSPAFVNGSSLQLQLARSWHRRASTVKAAFGTTTGALPTFTVRRPTDEYLSGSRCQAEPQVDEAKLAACDALALYLTSFDVQAARFAQYGWGPSNLQAQQLDAVKADIALSALAAQLNFSIGQGQYPGDYWGTATGLGDDVISGKLNDLTDAQLLERLQIFQDVCIGLIAR